MAGGSFVLMDKNIAMQQQMMNLCTISIKKIIKDCKYPIVKLK
jgi:hypothetical protein